MGKMITRTYSVSRYARYAECQSVSVQIRADEDLPESEWTDLAIDRADWDDAYVTGTEYLGSSDYESELVDEDDEDDEDEEEELGIDYDELAALLGGSNDQA